jgi:Fur family ferric uptake transcriptional regulator
MSHHQRDYEAIIRAAGHRVTPQRVHILDAVCAAGQHTTLGLVYARLRAAGVRIDRSTLYRTLRLFTELGLVVAAQPGDGETYYEIAGPQPHHHLVCRQCGREWEIDAAVLQPVIEQVAREHGFRVQSDHLVLAGTCAACQRAPATA